MRKSNFPILTFLPWLLISCASTPVPPDKPPQVDKARAQAFCENAAQQNIRAAAQRFQGGQSLESIVMEFVRFAEKDGMDRAYRNATVEMIAALLVDRDSLMSAYQKVVTICVSLQ